MRLVLETAIGPVLPLSDGKDREARWDSAAATGGVTQDPPCSRADRQGPAPPRWRSAAKPNVQPGWLVKPLPRRGAWKGLRHRPHNAADRLRHISAGAIDGRGCAIGCAGLSPSALAKWAGQIRLVGSPFSHAMLRIHGDRSSLLAALTAHWADQQLQIPQALRPVVAPLSRRPRQLR
jgi:hypothetical protein